MQNKGILMVIYQEHKHKNDILINILLLFVSLLNYFYLYSNSLENSKDLIVSIKIYYNIFYWFIYFLLWILKEHKEMKKEIKIWIKAVILI